MRITTHTKCDSGCSCYRQLFLVLESVHFYFVRVNEPAENYGMMDVG